MFQSNGTIRNNMNQELYKSSEIKTVFKKWLRLYLVPERQIVRDSVLRHFWAQFEDMLIETHKAKSRRK